MSISSFIVTSLQLGLDTLAAKAETPGQGLLTKDSIPILEGFIAATEVLIESAEEVGASCGDPIMRGGIFDYAKKIRQQSALLQEVLEGLENGTGDDVQMQEQTAAALRTIGELTSQLVEIEEDQDQKALNETAKECAGAAKALVVKAVNSPEEISAKALSLVKTLKGLSAKYEPADAEVARQLNALAVAISEVSPKLVDAVKLATDKVDDGKALIQNVRVLAGYIQQSLDIGNGRGKNTLKRGSKIEIPATLRRQAHTTTGRRKKTIESSAQGTDMLRRARSITRNMETKKEIMETLSIGTTSTPGHGTIRSSSSFASLLATSASTGGSQTQASPSPPPQSSSSSSSTLRGSEALLAEVHQLRAENERLRTENERLRGKLQKILTLAQE